MSPVQQAATAPARTGTRPATTRLRAPARKRAVRSGRPLSHYVAGGVAMVVLVVFFALLLPTITPREHESRSWVVDTKWDSKGTITMAPQGEYCRQMMLDNAKGEVIDLGLVRCGNAAPGAAGGTASPAPEGNRLDAVRRAFSNR